MKTGFCLGGSPTPVAASPVVEVPAGLLTVNVPLPMPVTVKVPLSACADILVIVTTRPRKMGVPEFGSYV